MRIVFFLGIGSLVIAFITTFMYLNLEPSSNDNPVNVKLSSNVNQKITHVPKKPISPTTAVTRSSQKISSCGLSLSVQGDQEFLPETCKLEIRTPGPSCGADNNEQCPKHYVFEMSDDTEGTIRDVQLYFDDLSAGTYRFNPSSTSKDFTGQMTNHKNVARNVQEGTVTVGPIGETIDVQFELYFNEQTSMTGAGSIPVRSVAGS